MAYSDKVLGHYKNPRNVGTLDKSSAEVGTGLVGAPECGDVMRLQIKVNPETQVIEDAKFKTFGCGSAIASSSPRHRVGQGQDRRRGPHHHQHRYRQGARPPAGQDPLLGAGGRRDPRRNRRLEKEKQRHRRGRRRNRRGGALSCNRRSRMAATHHVPSS